MSIVPVGGRWTLTVLHQHGKTLTIQISEVCADYTIGAISVIATLFKKILTIYACLFINSYISFHY